MLAARVVLPLLLDHHLRSHTVPETLDAQAFVPELAVEALINTVLPRRAQVDQRQIHILVLGPPQDGTGDELRPIVGTQVARRAVHADQLQQHLH